MRRVIAPIVVAVLALAPVASGAGSPSVSVAASSVGKGGLSIAAVPQSGKLPLTVTFTLTAPKAASWRLDFGDGKSEGATGAPPAKVTHVYRGKGSFTARLSTTYATVTTRTTLPAVKKTVTPRPIPGATTSPSALPLVIIGVVPGTKAQPRRVEFSLATVHPKKISGWQLVFGDGKQQTGTGTPPASVSHTYAHGGTFKAYVVLSEAAADHFSRYSVPPGGVRVSIP